MMRDFTQAWIVIGCKASFAWGRWEFQRFFADCAAIKSSFVLRFMNNCPFFWIASTRHICCEYNVFIDRNLTNTVFFNIFGENNSRIDLNRQCLHFYSLFLLLNTIFIIEKSTNTIKSIQLVEWMINNETFCSIPWTKLAKYLVLWQFWKRRLKVAPTLLINIRIKPFSFFQDVHSQRVPKLKAGNTGDLINIQISLFRIYVLYRFWPYFKLPQNNCGCKLVRNSLHAKIEHHSLTFASNLSFVMMRWLFAKHLLHLVCLVNSFDLILNGSVF